MKNSTQQTARKMLLPAVVIAVAIGLGPGTLAACSSAPKSDAAHATAKPAGPYVAEAVAGNVNVELPAFATGDVRQGYQYALRAPERLQFIPCYCGCGLTAAHKNNLDCYIAGVDEEGMAIFDNHASFCAICLEITNDVERLSAEGKSLRDIRAIVDQAHGEKGPGTETPLPPS